jgi:ribonuclease R
MKELLHKLQSGVELAALNKKELRLLLTLTKKDIIQETDYLHLSTKFRFGTIDIIPSGTGFLSQESGEKDILIESHALKGARSGDFVIAKRDYKSKGRPKAEVYFIVERAVTKTLAYLSHEDNNVIAYDFKFEQKVRLKVKQKALRQLPHQTVVVIDNETEDFVDILGVMSEPSIDEIICLYKAGRSEAFSKAVQKEVASYGDTVEKSYYPDRKDLTHLDFITIDPKTAKDFDDAIYFDTKEHTLYVAIADVTAYVHPHMEVDIEAKNRGFTIYFPHKSIPMLPRELSENLCSLKPNVDRLSYVFKIILNQSTLAIRKFELFEAIINSKRRFNYDEVDDAFNHEITKEDKKFFDFLTPLSKITESWRKSRLQDGFDFENSEYHLQLDENLNLLETTTEEQTLSHRLIEECMLKTNQCAASYFNEGIYRIHEAPAPKSIDNLISDLIPLGIDINIEHHDIHSLVATIQAKAKTLEVEEEVDKLIIRSLKRAQYSFHNVGHFGLGFDAYTHFTSPIRRYSDLILHRYLKAIIANDKKQEIFIHSTLPTLTTKISQLEELSNKVAWEYEDRVFTRWANEHIGDIFQARVVDLHPIKPPIVKLDDKIKGARIFLAENSPSVELFESVKIEIIAVNLATAKIYAQIVEQDSHV